jgi:hypothetical protein
MTMVVRSLVLLSLAVLLPTSMSWGAAMWPRTPFSAGEDVVQREHLIGGPGSDAPRLGQAVRDPTGQKIV